ncbi:hypothetical protein D3C71_959020 [compost metagenome]
MTGVEPHLARIRIVDIFQRRLALTIEVHVDDSARRRSHIGGISRDRIALYRDLTAKCIGIRGDIRTPEADRLAHAGEAGNALLGRIVFLDGADHHILWLVGQGIQHVEQEAAIGKAQGAGGGAQHPATRPAQGGVQGVGGRS